MDDHSRAPHDPTGDATGDETEPHLPPPHRPGAAHLDATGPIDMDEVLADEPQRLPSRPVSAPPAMDDRDATVVADPDATVAADPVVAGAYPPADTDPDATTAVDPDATTAVDPDATMAVDPGATAVAGAESRTVDADATQIVPVDPDATRVVPPRPKRELDETAVAPVDDQWRAQAHAPVRPRADLDEPSGGYRAVEPGRNWLLPVLLGLAGVVFIIGIAYALLVATRDNGGPAAPSPTPTRPVASTPPASPTPPSASPSPSSTTPSQGPTGQVQLPVLTGQSLAEAESTLNALGLPFTEVPQVDDTHAPNTVIKTSPDPGLVNAGTSITLTYAVPSASPSGPEPSASPS